MKRVFLVGYMGAGKTTVGKELAKLAGLSFIDLDYYIEGRYHKAVSQIFAERGEEAFREIERNMLHEVAEFEDVLISTGSRSCALSTAPSGIALPRSRSWRSVWSCANIPVRC